MKRKTFILSCILVLGILLVGLSGGAVGAQEPGSPGRDVAQAALGTAFSYQGRLNDGGAAANGAYDLEFKLYDDASVGSQVGSTATHDDVVISDGLFNVELDFGVGAFDGDARWLEIGVRAGSSTGAYTTLTPRQSLLPAPYASALPGLWTQPNASSPNLIGGHNGNSVASGVVGATISGGGYADNNTNTINQVSGNYGVIGGGLDNNASGYAATISGGRSNIASGDYYPTIGGGWGNHAVGAWLATVSGGGDNFASGNYATVPGGRQNTAQGNYSFAAGYQAEANHQGSFVWADSGGANLASTANDQFLVRASGGVSLNVAGGALRLEPDAASPNVIGGYSDNSVTGGVVGATISGGGRAPDNDWGSNNVSGDYGAIGGGNSNQVTGAEATIAGGHSNQAGGDYASVAGGSSNLASGLAATAGGGNNNQASGDAATVPGGFQNTAQGDYSFAAGVRAKANYQGCFVWGDANFSDVTCDANNQFIVRASGGVTMYSSSNLASGVVLPAGSGAWSNLSDRNLKENLAPVDAQEVLARLAEIPISTWNYKSQDVAIRHIGPIAQDFYAAFGLGEDDKHINTLDANGIALVAIQGLEQLVQAQNARIETLEAQNAALQQQCDDLATRAAALDRQSSAPATQPGNWSWGFLGIGLLVGLALVGRKKTPGQLRREGR